MIRNRKLNRLTGFDYSNEGYYFVTICVKDKTEWFGEIKDGRMMLNEYGKIVLRCWDDLINHYMNTKLDEFIIMPNHLHGILSIVGNGFKPFRTLSYPFRTLSYPFRTLSYPFRTLSYPFRTLSYPFRTLSYPFRKNHGLSEIMRGLKTFSSRRINETINDGMKFQWQKSFYDHIIRNEQDLTRVRDYIVNNPLKWEEDTENVKS